PLATIEKALAGQVDAGALGAVTRALEADAPPVSIDSLMTTACMAAGRLANAVDLGGGHMAHDAGAASSLASLGAAVASLGAGECDRVIVAGVAPLIGTAIVLAHRRRMALAGERGGLVLAEGAFAVVVEREAD